MNLAPIEIGPRPTAAELAGEVTRLRCEYPNAEDRLLTSLAELDWSWRRREENPDDFLVPFVTWIQSFPKGISSYEDYLRSDLWKSIRTKVLTRANFECACCSRRATQVHHRDYRPRVLSGQDLSPLIPLCAECHNIVDKHNGKAREIWQDKERVLSELIATKSRSKS
jgi:5-methylcytosine-specific restriction endonuclease McrA